jgi:hypothetical protein
MNVFLQGLIQGVVLGFFNSSMSSLGTSPHLAILSQLLWVFDIAAYLYVGFMASRVTGKTGTGTLVGLFTGLFSALVGVIGTVYNTITNMDALRQSTQRMADQQHLGIHYTNNTIILSVLFGAFVALLIALVLGTIFGTIGGAIGKNQAKHTPAPESTEYTHELIEK